MPETGQPQLNRALLTRALAGLDELATGRFAERMRRDAAARVLVTVKRVQQLRSVGLLAVASPRQALSRAAAQAQRRAVGEVERITAGWLPSAMTAAEFVGDLPPADVKLLTDLAPLWANALAAAARG